MPLIRNLLTVALLGGSLFSLPFPAFAANGAARIEVAFVLDTTGSMAGLIDGAKRKIWSIANTIVDINPDADIRMALIGYRDRGDDYVVETHDMSPDLQGLYGKLIRFEADGGGDTPESVNEALDTAVRKLGWDKAETTRRIIFLVGDAPPHMDYDNAPLYPEVLKTAAERDITVNAVQAGDDPDTRAIWREIAQMGHGEYIPIPQDGGEIVVIETPYDDEIIHLQRQIDGTVMPYGDAEKQEEVRSKMEAKAAAPSSVVVENSEFYSKRMISREVITGGGDLVADIKNGARRLDEVADDALPEPMQSKTAGEREVYLKKKIEERDQLEKRMADLVKKRDGFTAEKRKTEDKKDSFDSVVAETLRSQLR
ncbi:MAG: hypothetical protein BGN83_05475 [Rhizobium sp. 63-7]|nr:MAG: hypothetical protein BGN83_05475 [Rhizobium sp. 63-7]